jgi:hypothetical protein
MNDHDTTMVPVSLDELDAVDGGNFGDFWCPIPFDPFDPYPWKPPYVLTGTDIYCPVLV